MRLLHFLHIGKCAGTQIKALAEKINANNPDVRIMAHPHRVTLANLPPDAEYFFSIRSPDTRFVSGFYSRKRKGRPRYHVEWSANEKQAFDSFEHANDLAEALFEDGDAGFCAFAAMKSIEHVAIDQSDYFRSLGFFLSQRLPVAIIRQEHFDGDMKALFRKLALQNAPSIESDSTTAHRNDYSGVRPLSGKALDNLRRWYAQDFELYKQCCNWLANKSIDS